MNQITKIETKKTTNTTTGAAFLIQLLKEQGTDTIFGYPGAPILPIYDSLINDNQIKHVLCRHEQGAVHAAEGYAKVKDKCGIVLVTSGPGFSNTLTGIMNAYTDGTPLVIICGQTETIGHNEFQEANISEITRTFTKATIEIENASDIEKSIKTAFSIANKIPKAPVVVSVKKSILKEEIENNQTYRIKKEIKVAAPHSCILKTIDILKNSKKPLIIAGGGCNNAENELIELAHLTHIPIVSTLMAKGRVDDVSLGMIGLSGDKELNDSIENADTVLVLGSRLTTRTTKNKEIFLPKSKIININIEHNKSNNVKPAKEIIGEIDIILQQIIGVIKSKNITFDIKYDWIEQLSRTENNTSKKQELTGEDVLTEIYNYTKKYNPIITTDVGMHQIMAAKIFKTTSSKKFLTAGGFGTMGFGLPASIGAYFGMPDSLILNITGDGSFQMNMQELGTISQYNIPIKIFIMNNSSLGMIKKLQEKKYSKPFQSDLINPDFTKIAESYGIKGYKITNINDLKNTLPEIFKYKKAVLLDIKTTD